VSSAAEVALPGLRAAALVLAGTVVTFQGLTHRHRGRVGGFPQTTLWRSRGPRLVERGAVSLRGARAGRTELAIVCFRESLANNQWSDTMAKRATVLVDYLRPVVRSRTSSAKGCGC